MVYTHYSVHARLLASMLLCGHWSPRAIQDIQIVAIMTPVYKRSGTDPLDQESYTNNSHNYYCLNASQSGSYKYTSHFTIVKNKIHIQVIYITQHLKNNHACCMQQFCTRKHVTVRNYLCQHHHCQKAVQSLVECRQFHPVRDWSRCWEFGPLWPVLSGGSLVLCGTGLGVCWYQFGLFKRELEQRSQKGWDRD